MPEVNINTDIMVAARKLGTASRLSDEEKVAQEKQDKAVADDIKSRKRAVAHSCLFYVMSAVVAI